jgi:hypothetical protein
MELMRREGNSSPNQTPYLEHELGIEHERSTEAREMLLTRVELPGHKGGDVIAIVEMPHGKALEHIGK